MLSKAYQIELSVMKHDIYSAIVFNRNMMYDGMKVITCDGYITPFVFVVYSVTRLILSFARSGERI